MLRGIAFKVASAFLFTLMSALIRWIGDSVPLGEVVFARSLFALLPICLWLMWRRELGKAVRTSNPRGHFLRSFIGVGSMFMTFAALARLPLPDATAIGYAAPLITVVLAYFILHERIGAYRWAAVAVGLVGVVVILWPHLASGALADMLTGGGPGRATEGAVIALGGAFLTAGAMIQVRRLTQTERTGSIVFFFSLFSALIGLLTAPLGWHWPDTEIGAALVLAGILGGVAQILLTQSYRYADASLIAPFEYTTIVWSLAIGWLAFGDVPHGTVYAGGAIVIGSGVFVILRERRLGIERARARKASPPAA
jgi:drug/metabolite transporter (DMT)-like permease